MAEARIHFLLDTVVRAQAQLDEQKHYCLASLDTLVKLLPLAKGGRRKGFGQRSRLVPQAAQGSIGAQEPVGFEVLVTGEAGQRDSSRKCNAREQGDLGLEAGFHGKNGRAGEQDLSRKCNVREQGDLGLEAGFPGKHVRAGEQDLLRKCSVQASPPAAVVSSSRKSSVRASRGGSVASQAVVYQECYLLREGQAEQVPEAVHCFSEEEVQLELSEGRGGVSKVVSASTREGQVQVRTVAEDSTNRRSSKSPDKVVLATQKFLQVKESAGKVHEATQHFSEGEGSPDEVIIVNQQCFEGKESAGKVREATQHFYEEEGSPDKIPGATQHFVEGDEVSGPTQHLVEGEGCSDKVRGAAQRFSESQGHPDKVLGATQCSFEEEGCADKVVRASQQFSEVELASTGQDPGSATPRPVQPFSVRNATAPREHSSLRKAHDQVPAVLQGFCGVVTTKEPGVQGGRDEEFKAVRQEARDHSLNADRHEDTEESWSSEASQAAGELDFCSKEARVGVDELQRSGCHSEGIPLEVKSRDEVLEGGSWDDQNQVRAAETLEDSMEVPGSTRKRHASVTGDKVPECESPDAGLEEQVQSVKRLRTSRSRTSRVSPAAGEQPNCGSRNFPPSEVRILAYYSAEEAGVSEELQRSGCYHSEGNATEAHRLLESRVQVSETGASSNSNLVASVRSFLPLVVQQPAVPIANGKKDVRVKALEAAEAARRLEEKRLEERKLKLESLKREQKTRLDQEKQKKFEEDQRKKDEERKKELELNAKKRKKEEVEKKEREEKRRKVEDALRLKKEQEEKLRAELEEKEQRRKVMEEAARERKALEEEMKKQKRLEKEREIERRRKADEDAKAAWLASKEAERKRREETFQRMKVLEKEQRSHGASALGTSELPVRGTSLNLAKESLGLDKEQRSRGASVLATSQLPTRGTSLKLAKQSLGLDTAGEKFVGTPALRIRSCGGSRMMPVVPISDLEESDDDGPTSYEISPYKSSSEDEGKEKKQKAVPRWARKENLTLHLMRQVHIDPDAIFSGAKSCSLNEVFGTTGNKKRRDFSQRNGSGDWVADMVTWKEELEYKKTMGYLQPRAG